MIDIKEKVVDVFLFIRAALVIDSRHHFVNLLLLLFGEISVIWFFSILGGRWLFRELVWFIGKAEVEVIGGGAIGSHHEIVLLCVRKERWEVTEVAPVD